MSSIGLDIARAGLSAGLLRPDAVSEVDRPSMDGFLQLLTAAINKCDNNNVQKCKRWIVSNVATSATRTQALGKYLVALAKSQVDNGRKPSSKRRRLHILYVLGDVFHHLVRKHGKDSEEISSLWKPFLPMLFASAAAYKNAPKHKKKLEDLVAIWKERKLLSLAVLSTLEEAVARGKHDGDAALEQGTSASIRLAKDVPYMIPSMHGDPTAPWYQLPAANWLQHIKPNSTRPMNPIRMRPTQLQAGPAEPSLVGAVQDLMSNVERLFSKTLITGDDPNSDLNELGERVVCDEDTGEIVSGETYYGWSPEFCEQMTLRKKGKQSRGRSQSISVSLNSRSASPPASKRRRYSSRSRDRKDSRTRSRSPENRGKGSYRGRSDTRSRSRSYTTSRSRSTGRRSDGNRSSRRRSRSRSASPRRGGFQGKHRGKGQSQYLSNQKHHAPPSHPTMPPFSGPGSNQFPPPNGRNQSVHPPPPPPPPPPHPYSQFPPQDTFNQGSFSQQHRTFNYGSTPQMDQRGHTQQPHQHQSGRGQYGRGGGYRDNGRGGFQDNGRGGYQEYGRGGYQDNGRGGHQEYGRGNYHDNGRGGYNHRGRGRGGW